MTKLGIIVGEDLWIFFNQIYDDLVNYYQTNVFKRKIYDVPIFYRRLNRWALQEGMHSMLLQNDVCFFEWASEYLMYASSMPKRSAIIARLHSFEIFEWASKINWDAVDKIILVSHAMRNSFGELYPDHIHKTEVIYNGVSLSDFKPAKLRTFKFDLGMLCSIKPIKRIYEVILSVHELIKLGYQVRLHIAGEPGRDMRYAMAVYRLVEKLGLENAVKFYGHVSDTANWLSKIDIFISNSYWEGQQVALLEAMASGCYCLSHFWAGADEMLPVENLFATEGELQRKIIEFADQTEMQREQQRSLMRAIANEKFDIEQTKVRIREVIETV